MTHYPFDYKLTCRIEECLDGGQRYYRLRLRHWQEDTEIVGGWRRSIKRATASAFEELWQSMRA